jgi:hypothetical protein
MILDIAAVVLILFVIQAIIEQGSTPRKDDNA